MAHDPHVLARNARRLISSVPSPRPPPSAGVLGGAHVRRRGGGPHIRFPASTQIRRLPRTHEGPGQRSGGRLRRQRGQRHHHSGDGAKIAPRTQSHLAAYICVFVYISCKKETLEFSTSYIFFCTICNANEVCGNGLFCVFEKHTHASLFGTTYIFLSKLKEEESKRIVVKPFVKLLCHISTYDEPFLCFYILILHTYG